MEIEKGREKERGRWRGRGGERERGRWRGRGGESGRMREKVLRGRERMRWQES